MENSLLQDSILLPILFLASREPGLLLLRPDSQRTAQIHQLPQVV